MNTSEYVRSYAGGALRKSHVPILASDRRRPDARFWLDSPEPELGGAGSKGDSRVLVFRCSCVGPVAYGCRCSVCCSASPLLAPASPRPRRPCRQSARGPRVSSPPMPCPPRRSTGSSGTQVVVGDRLFAARRVHLCPPGRGRPGTRRGDALEPVSYNLPTGTLNTSRRSSTARFERWRSPPTAATLFVGGNFTRVGPYTRNRFAAFRISTGAVADQAPKLQRDRHRARRHRAARCTPGATSPPSTALPDRGWRPSRPSVGALTGWAPVADDTVRGAYHDRGSGPRSSRAVTSLGQRAASATGWWPWTPSTRRRAGPGRSTVWSRTTGPTPRSSA